MNRSLLIFFIACACFFLPRTAFAQDFPMLHYGVEDGLPSNNIYSVYRDSRGFLWFATDKGIARYNGLRFETFTTFNGLPDNEIFFFKEDYSGRMWLGTYNGELCYYKDGVFHTSANTPFLKMPIKTPHIYNINVNADSSVTFNFFNFQILLEIKNERKKILDFKSLKDSTYDHYIYYKKKVAPNYYELIYERTIIYADSLCNAIKQVDKQFPGFTVYIPSQDNGYFINTTGYFTTKNDYILSPDLNVVHMVKDSIYFKKTIHAYYCDGNSTLVATSGGLIINDSLKVLSPNNVSSITQDYAGNYWVATLNNGVYCFSKNFLQTRLYKNVSKEEVKYCENINNNIYFITNDNDLYLFKNGQSHCLFDYDNYQPTSFKYAKEGGYVLDVARGYYYTFYDNKTTIYDMNRKKAYVANYLRPLEPYGTKQAFVAGNKVYIKGRSAIMFFDYAQLKTADVIGYKFAYNNLDQQRIYGMAQSGDSSILFSTLTNMYSLKNDSVVILSQFNNVTLKYMIFFGKKILGYTHDNQFLVFDNINNNLSIDTIPQQNCIWDKLYILDSIHVLVTTNNLYRLLTLKTVNSKEHFFISTIENKFIPTQAEAITSDSFNCFFFKNSSLVTIPKSSLYESSIAPKIYFTSLKTAKGSYQINSSVEISFNESKNITISFSRLIFKGKDILQQYSISKNGQNNWIDIKGEEIDLVSPGYGEYVIRLRAKGMLSDYSVPAVFTLHISRPFWATWWFITLLMFSSITIVVVSIRFRINYLLRKKAREHETELKFIKSEYKALNALMNPHFIFNTLNNVQGLVNRNDKLAANEYLRVFADIIRQNMHNISKDLIPLQKEVDLVTNYLILEKLRFKELLNFVINIDENVDLGDIMVPPLLVQPLVENSIKHGILPMESSEGYVCINIYEKRNIIYIEVKDNGIGMERSKEKSKNSLHESFGMENIKKRMEQLSIMQGKEVTLQMGEEHDEAGNLLWTIVTISMPIS